MSFLKAKLMFFAAFALRMILVLYGLWQDKYLTVKYTDIDYVVFTDAGGFMLQNESPYKRSTYRYTPLLAMLMQFNLIINESFGKLIFCSCDIIVAYISFLILKNNLNVRIEDVILYLCSWLFNPLSFTISSRGNAESIVVMFVVLFLYFLTYKPTLSTVNMCAAGCMYGLAVHLKIYPLTYAPAVYLYINCKKNKFCQCNKSNVVNEDIFLLKKCSKMLLPTKGSVAFGLSALAVISSLTYTFYMMYGKEFISETYLYHITRKDIRHNFSPYFYLMYLSAGDNGDDAILKLFSSLIAFVPQVVLAIGIAFKYHEDIIFSCFIQTCIFVVYNKVCTSQYFLWFLGLLPLVIGNINMTKKKALKLFCLWMMGQALWLMFAYLLEFQSMNMFLYIWISGLLFFCINNYIILQITTHYKSNLNVKKYAND